MGILDELDAVTDGSEHPLAEVLVVIAQHIEAIEARQRFNQQHDPGCEKAEQERRQRHLGTATLSLRPCTCWLAKTKEEPT